MCRRGVCLETRLHRLLSAEVSRRADAVILSLDLRDAFTSVRRDCVLSAARQAGGDVYVAARAVAATDTWHVVMADGDARTVTQRVGLDQGCPLSPGLFAVAVAPALQEVTREVCRIDPQAKVVAFLDDTYIVGTPAACAAGRRRFEAAMKAIGLDMHPTKTKVWGRGCRRHIPRPEELCPASRARAAADAASEPSAPAGRSSRSSPALACRAGTDRAATYGPGVWH